jgi:hypothetical protein
MLIDAQYLGTNWRMILTRSPLQAAKEITLHGSGANLLSAPETTAVDAVQVLLKDHFLKAFRSSLERLNSGNLLAEAAAAIEAAAFAHL